MIEPILKGLAMGLMLAVLPGPVFFALIQTAIDRGFKQGVAMALGIMLSDVSYMLLTYIGLSKLGLEKEGFGFWVGLLGGSIMLAFGLSLVLSKVALEVKDKTLPSKGALLKTLGVGYALNALNPAVVLFWIGINSWLLKQDYNVAQDFEYFTAIAVAIFGTDLLKIYFSQRLGRILTKTFMLWLKRIIGLFLMGFGLKLLLEAFFPGSLDF